MKFFNDWKQAFLMGFMPMIFIVPFVFSLDDNGDTHEESQHASNNFRPLLDTSTTPPRKVSIEKQTVPRMLSTTSTGTVEAAHSSTLRGLAAFSPTINSERELKGKMMMSSMTSKAKPKPMKSMKSMTKASKNKMAVSKPVPKTTKPATTKPIPKTTKPATKPMPIKYSGGGNIFSPRLSSTAKLFIEKSLVPGLLNDVVEEGTLVVEGDDTYEISANITTREHGIVSLAGVEAMLETITCFTDAVNNGTGSVIIKFTQSLLRTDLASMFPTGALLTINEELWGECQQENANEIVENPAFLSNVDQFKNATGAGDGYLVITSAALTGNNEVLVSGNWTYFFEMFEDGNINIKLLEEGVMNLRRGRNLGTRSIKLEGQFNPNRFITAKAVGALTDKSRISVVNASFGMWGFDFTIKVVEEYSVDVEIDVAIDVGVPTSITGNKSIVSELIAPAPLKIIRVLKKVRGLPDDFAKLPDIKVGLYFEALLVVELTRSALEMPFGPYVSYDYSSGRKEVDLRIWFKPFKRDVGVKETLVSRTSPSSTLDMGIKGNLDGRQIDVEVFAGLRSQLMLYLSKYIYAGVLVDSGAKIATKTEIDEDSSFGPVDVSDGRAVVGSCDKCHDFEGNLSSVVRSPKASFVMEFPYPILGWKPPTFEKQVSLIPGDPELGELILTVCALEDADDELCGKACCSGNKTEGGTTAPNGTTPEGMIEPGNTTESTTAPGNTTQGTIDVDPCFGSTDTWSGPCCGSSDPCCGVFDPCCGRDCALVSGDPHLISFDGVSFSCQAAGEFYLSKSNDSNMQVQARFKSASILVSLATSVAATGGAGDPIVQFGIRESDNELELLVDGVPQDTESDYDDSRVSVSKVFSLYKISFKSSGLIVAARVVDITSFRHLDVRVALPSSFREETIVGLFGSPDGDAGNDLSYSTGGGPVSISASDLMGEAAYDYCRTNWCIEDASDSLFTYEDDTFNFEFFYLCDVPYSGSIDTSTASQELGDLCGINMACIIDGIELGVDGAQSLLQAEGELLSASRSMLSRFWVAPAAIVAGSSVNVELTVNLKGSGVEAGDVTSYRVYLIDGETGQAVGVPLVVLRDNGFGVGSDTVANDLVFSNILAIASSVAGETFSFWAVPVIYGSLAPDSPFAFSVVNGVRSFSQQSGVGIGNNNKVQTIVEPTIEGLVVHIEYSWPADQPDLDTGTFFLGSGVGFACGEFSEYINFYGDDTGVGGWETASIFLGLASADSQFVNETSIQLYAGWNWIEDIYGSGPITVNVFTDTSTASFVANPGAQFGCASTMVGEVTVKIGPTGLVLLQVIPVFLPS